MTNPKRLTRSRSHRMIGGVCGGLAEWLGWRPGTVRLLFVLSCLLPGPQFLIYLILWITVPLEDR
ncbi:PspC domain-containing protein [Amycolatopsis alkalitolerans]|uniref:PspC domain-containing protein n=1 Tax=Amycolatopsis alkalitolerans TaxID=2547244 RepID=A0A5C4M7B3_9PSEU|nr:PspC domain-containing protein [Amycolatopsis alkalitolerans]TNC26933.1 PspC domain-containing protein [Amycolatopsis alkalitolerans]